MTVEPTSEAAAANAARDEAVGGPCVSASAPRAVYSDHVEGKWLVYGSSISTRTFTLS